MNPKNHTGKLYGLIFLFFIIMLTSQTDAKNNDLSNGIWFICEYAHSQISPEDDCNMLDDDGFQIIDGIVHFIKIKNSIETRCRHNRVGNCFLRTHVGLVAERSEIGPIKLFENKPELMRINEEIQHDEGMKKSLELDIDFSKKKDRID